MGMDYRDTLAWQRIQTDVVQTVVSTPVQLVAANPQRVGLIMSCDGTQDVFLSPTPDPAGNPGGMCITRDSGPVILDHAHHGALVQVEWWVTSGTAGIDCLAIELIMDMPPTPFQAEQERQNAHTPMPLHDAARP